MAINFPAPLRLAVGSHVAGSGKGCAMNVVSWENGDKRITDFPQCSDRFLARIVQRVNDNICKHRECNLLCAECSIKVLALAHRTVGTNLLVSHTNAERAEIYAKIARTEVFYVAAADAADADAAATYAIYAAADANAANAADAYAAAAAANAADDAVDAAANAANAADYADAAADAATYAEFLLTQGHRIIDEFEAFSGVKATPVNESVTITAVQQMKLVSV